MTEVMDETACAECYETGGRFVTVNQWPSSVQVCEDCSRSCDGCGQHYVDDGCSGAVTNRGEWLCDNCYSLCDGCGDVHYHDDIEYHDGRGMQYCSDCYPGNGYGDDGTIQGYGHTSGSIWLRTADAPPKGERYYLGMELEIYTDNMTARPIMDWAEQNLGYRDAIIGKEDSSVDGFEICTQPMTPQFFEQVNWESFFRLLNEEYPLPAGEDEPTGHGLHVHIGRVAFGKDDIMVAAFAYLLSQSTHLERIARRQPTGYCNKVKKPVSTAILSTEKHNKQYQRLRQMGLYPGRDAINLTNAQTIEVRAFKSTRDPGEFREAVRVVYAAAEYIRSLRESKVGGMAKALHWSEFARWTAINLPEAFASISGLKK